MITASKTALAQACAYWLGVPLPAEDASDSATFGTEVHAAIEASWPIAAEAPTLRPEVAAHVARALHVLTAWRHCPTEMEAAFGYDGVRSRYLGIGRASYAERETGSLVAGTVDLLVRVGGEGWQVRDWKTGEHGARKAGPQLRTLAALVLEANGGEWCDMFADCTETGETVEYGRLDAFDARAHLDALAAVAVRATYRGAYEQPIAPVRGEHCADGYCPLRGTCPAYAEVAALVPVGDLLRERRNPLTLPIDDEETARAAVDLLGAVEDVIDKKKRELRAYITEHGGRLDLGDGRSYAPVRATRRGGIDGDAALALAEKLGATEDDRSACLKPGSTYDVWKVLGKRKAG